MIDNAPTWGSVTNDLEYIASSWPILVTLKIPGTARSWVETPRRSVLSASDLERMGKKGVPRQSPADVGVLDLLQMIASTADDLARTITDVAELGPEFLPLDSAAKDPRPWFSVAGTWLLAAHRVDPKTIPWVASALYPLTSQMSRLLGDVRDGQVMNGICPWCHGRNKDSTTGERTMQIHYPDPNVIADEPLIFCRGWNCAPPSSACGTRWNDCPAWNQREWEWLAAQLRTPSEIEHAAGGDAA